MVSLSALWLPIILSAVAVFFVSAVLHMVLPYHFNDYGKVPSEERVMAALQGANITPGDYALPHAASPKEMSTPEFTEKRNRGPVVFMTVFPSPPPPMSRHLTLWFLLALAVSLMAAYVASRAVGPGAPYLDVFRFSGTSAFLAYAVGGWQESIWYGRSWSTTLKNTFDGLVYALATAGMFGWLWPN